MREGETDSVTEAQLHISTFEVYHHYPGKFLRHFLPSAFFILYRYAVSIKRQMANVDSKCWRKVESARGTYQDGGKYFWTRALKIRGQVFTWTRLSIL